MEKDRYITSYDYYVQGKHLFYNEYSLDSRTTVLVTELMKDPKQNEDELKAVYKMWLYYKTKLNRHKKELSKES